jgi:cytochrome c-type biogenesis protein CcmH
VRGRALYLVGASVLLGAAGYLLQGQPGVAGAPAKNTAQGERASITVAPNASSAQRQANADALMQKGRPDGAFAEAKTGLETDPKNTGLWVAAGNALVFETVGALTPAAEHCFRQALRLDPQNREALYFYGMALSQAGRGEEAHGFWVQLARSIPEDEPQRARLLQTMLANGMIVKEDLVLSQKAAQKP